MSLNWRRDQRPKRYGWAPGSYMGSCGGEGCRSKSVEDKVFIGDKRATMCADCAYALPWPPAQSAPRVPQTDTARAIEAFDRLKMLEASIAEAIELLASYMTDEMAQPGGTFDDFPDIDSARNQLQDALDGDWKALADQDQANSLDPE